MSMRRFKLTQKAEPHRNLGEGVLFGNGKVAVLDWRHEIVLPFRSLEQLLRDHAEPIEIEWIDAAEDV